MTIKTVRAIPAQVAVNLENIHIAGPMLQEDVIKSNGRIRFISITDPQVGPLFDVKNSPHLLALQFHDIAPCPEEEHKTAEELGQHGCQLFTDEMAEQIVDFLLEAHNSTTEPELLLVNCMMGVSRSGAIVDFARVVFQLPYDETMRNNPQIRPNPTMLRKLYKTWAKKS